MSIDALFLADETIQQERIANSVKLDKEVGLSYLRSLSERTGIPNYATGRALSPSSFKHFMANPLKYIEKMCEPPQTEEERRDELYNSRKRHFLIGKVFEDYLRQGVEKSNDTIYRICSGDLTAGEKALAHADGKTAVRFDDYQSALQMYEETYRSIPSYVEKLRTMRHEPRCNALVDVAGIEVLINGFGDAIRHSEYGTDIKTIDSIADARRRVWEPYYGGFQYWLQAAFYSLIWNLQSFDFLFVSKKATTMILLVEIDQSGIEALQEYLITNWLTAFVWNLEHGFENLAPYEFRGALPRNVSHKATLF